MKKQEAKAKVTLVNGIPAEQIDQFKRDHPGLIAVFSIQNGGGYVIPDPDHAQLARRAWVDSTFGVGSLELNLRQLIRAGIRVGLCEAVEGK